MAPPRYLGDYSSDISHLSQLIENIIPLNNGFPCYSQRLTLSLTVVPLQVKCPPWLQLRSFYFQCSANNGIHWLNCDYKISEGISRPLPSAKLSSFFSVPWRGLFLPSLLYMEGTALLCNLI